MAQETCDCTDVNLGNTGLPGCVNVAKKTQKIIYVAKYDSTGALNVIPAGTTIDDAYLTTKLNETNPLDRWYPSATELDAVTNERAETVYQTLESGKKVRIRNGIKSFVANEVDVPTQYYAELTKFACPTMAAFLVDISGNLRGKKVDDSGDVYPICISKGSVDFMLLDSVGDTAQTIVHQFDWATTENDKYLVMITGITGDILNIQGLIPVSFTASNEALTGFTLTASTIYGTNVTGLVSADFKDAGVPERVYNVTQASTVVVTSVAESSTSVYDFVIPAQTSGDVIRVTLAKDGLTAPVKLVTLP